MSYKSISLFSGAGGMDIGVQNAGFDVLACVELDKHCCDTLRTNHARKGQETAVYEGDIKEFSPEQIMKEQGLRPGQLDLLFGGPPCQAFSLIGKQKSLEDERGMLLFQMVRFAAAMKPKAIMVEQVKGLLSAKGNQGKRGEVFEDFMTDLKQLGYNISWKLLNAADYGVPQTRQRVFIVGVRDGLENYEFPEETHANIEKNPSLFRKTPYATVGDVLKGLGPASPKGDERQDSHIDVTPVRDRLKISYVPEGEWLAKQTNLPDDIGGTLTRKDTTKYLRLNRQKPSNTLRCGEIFYHPTESRYLTPREYMRIHEYPDDYVLCGPIRSRTGTVKNLDQHRQIANSVPPRLAKVVAEQIAGCLECQKLQKFTDIPRTAMKKAS